MLDFVYYDPNGDAHILTYDSKLDVITGIPDSVQSLPAELLAYELNYIMDIAHEVQEESLA